MTEMDGDGGERYKLDEDLYSPDTYLRGIPHESYAKLRAECPVYFQEEPGGRGYWMVLKHEDVTFVSKNPQLFSSWRGGSNIEDYEGDDLTQIRFLMTNMDPPQHAKYRRLVRKGFTPRMVSAMGDKIRHQVKDILDGVEGREAFDFVREVAAELPLRVIADLMGVPQEDRGRIFDWSNRLIGFDDPEFQTSLEDGRIAAMEMWMYANDLAEQRAGEMGDDLVRVLLNAEIEGEKLTEMEFDAFFLLLSVAGNETTRNAISGGVLTFLQHPDQFQLLKDNPDKYMDSAVEEMLRFVSPLIYFRRTATQDIELNGQLIKENEKLTLMYHSANRDEDVFEDPQTFDITRDPNPHLSFGVGEHFCLGANLARLEIKIFFEELLKRVSDIELDGDVRRLRSNFINGIKEMPVRVKWSAK